MQTHFITCMIFMTHCTLESVWLAQLVKSLAAPTHVLSLMCAEGLGSILGAISTQDFISSGSVKEV